MIDTLSLPPFKLSPEDIAWVRATRDRMSTEAKVGHLFNHASFGDELDNIRSLGALKPGGLHRFMYDLEAGREATRIALEMSGDVPLLISGDIEGGITSFPFITPLPNQMGVAACDDLDLTVRMAAVVAEECRALGFNWTFAPVVDINHAFRSAVVGTRSYGSNADTVREQALAFVREIQRRGIAATAKHWPGEGFDDRDQHLTTTVNPLGMAQWEASFGKVYRAVIDAGVMSVMSAHIALPAWVRQRLGKSFGGGDDFRPASVSSLLNKDLLRGELGFNGLIVSDATTMAGLGSWGERAELVPMVIESGCDMFLFARNAAEDFKFMLDGLRRGALSEQRLEDAVTRVLGLKAALGLHRIPHQERLMPFEDSRRVLRSDAHMEVANAMASQGITLVKDTRAVLPLDAGRHRRVVVIKHRFEAFFPGSSTPTVAPLIDGLRAEGFEVRDFDEGALPTAEDTDLVLYLIGNEATPTASHIFLDWRALQGGTRSAMTRFWAGIPTLMVSFGQPYFLYDAPRMPAYVNAYTCLPPVLDALLRKLLGREAFTGVSPVDPFCGQESAHY